MASGFVTASGLDLDSVFAPQHSGWPQGSATEFFDGSGNDLYLRYAPLSTGSAASATGFLLSSGADLNTEFAAYGSTGVQVATQPSAISGSSAAGNPSGTVTSNTTSCSGTKGSGSYTYTWHIANGSGFTLTTPNSQTCAITGNVHAAQSVSGAIYCTISDGTTSANTSAVPASLQNTSPANPIFSITAAELKNSSGGGSNYIGFATNHQAYYGGSLNSESGFAGGTGVYEAFVDTSPVLAIFGISGLAADPGQASLGSVTINGVTLTGASATTYTYSGGFCQWQWTGSTFNLSVGSSYSGSIVRNGNHGW
jgi:hypothetical protein